MDDLADQALEVVLISSLFEAYPNLTQKQAGRNQRLSHGIFQLQNGSVFRNGNPSQHFPLDSVIRRPAWSAQAFFVFDILLDACVRACPSVWC
jgi:hypothetical protein